MVQSSDINDAFNPQQTLQHQIPSYNVRTALWSTATALKLSGFHTWGQLWNFISFRPLFRKKKNEADLLLIDMTEIKALAP